MGEDRRKAGRASGDLAGYWLLAALSGGGLLGSVALAAAAVSRYVAAANQELKKIDEAPAFLGRLEDVVVLAGLAAIAFLVGAGSLVVMLRSLLDDVARARRGPV